MQIKTSIQPPTRKERLVLRLMILIGIGTMAFFLFGLLKPQNIGYAPFFWTLMVGVAYLCLKTLHEWYHYFSISVPPTPVLSKQFSVDIFTTFCPGEPYPMVIKTLQAIQKINYPHTTYLCDEANDAYLKRVCQEMGVHHITRNDRKDAKAGNINNALRYATGELCVVLDPDHVPAPDFLNPVVPHFNNPNVGFVQVVQAYKNIHENLIAKGSAQQTFQFYGPMMMSMHTYGTVQAIGANCTFRRAALDSIGGHAAGLSEDMHTAMQLHARGWKSVYVPAILSRGLVPSTLSAYYKQQLKWSRGTFELLVSTYPKLFKHFTWRQKLHYGTLPFHFFCGVIFLLNFLIPILSLVFGVIPFRIDLVTFALLGAPLLASTILIRHYVQRWVMEEAERGFHMVGGWLLIGTWWIYILGLVFTIFRKKVPYVPTPKDGEQSDPWRLNLPNIAIAVLSVAAIIYGLAYDWNPYSFVMAGIAALNCLFMGFVILASYQYKFKTFGGRSGLFKRAGIHIKILKRRFWLARHFLYSGARKLALPLMVFIVFITAYLMLKVDEVEDDFVLPVSARQSGLMYAGIFSPASGDGLTSMQEVNDFQEKYNVDFNIISLYVAWGDEEKCRFPTALVNDIYEKGAVPMMTWEPWASLFDIAQGNPNLLNEQRVFHYITQGLFDDYLKAYATQIKALQRPFFLRFAHEFDNPAYPWSGRGNNTPEEFIKAWRYVHDFFLRQGVVNVIWVWNPWKPEAAGPYFPGEAYVDWIGVDILNYGSLNTDKNWYSFYDLYLPFHDRPLFQSGLPVMVAEIGSLKTEKRQYEWWAGAFKAINDHFPEISAVVFFNSDQDVNLPDFSEKDALDWKLQQPQKVLNALDTVLNESNHPIGKLLDLPMHASSRKSSSQLRLDTIRGVNFTKGQQWFKNYHTLTTRELNKDFGQLKALRINTIKRYGPTVYQRNLLEAARAGNINIHYGFWVPETLNFITDSLQASALTDEIISSVKKLKDRDIITAWNIGNDMLQQMQKRYYKPALLYHQRAYLAWLRNLLVAINEIDPARPITLDVEVSHYLAKEIELLQAFLPQIDAFGLIIYEDTTGMAQVKKLNVPYYFSRISVRHYLQLPESNTGVFVEEWQDTKTKTAVTFNGVLDQWGRQKPGYQFLAERWGKQPKINQLPPIKILRPAIPTLPGTKLNYQVLVFSDDQWVLANTLPAEMKFEWHLVKNNLNGEGMFMKKLGNGPGISVEIPEEPASFTIYLTATRADNVVTTQSILYTPFYKNE